MIVNPPENTAQNAEVLFIIETTAVAGAYISELRNNYIIPTLEYFHGGPIEEGSGGGTVYGIVTYKAADCLLVPPVSAAGPFTCPQSVLEEIDKIQFVGGQMESRACIAEALATAADAFDDLGRGDVPQHAVLLCCSAPYGAYGGGIVPPGTPMTLEAAARALASRGVQSSVVATRRLGAFSQLFEWLGGDVAHAAQRNFSKDGRHMVLLRGYSLKERPPSPAPPPVPDIQTMADVYGGGRGQPPIQRPPVPGAVPVVPAAGGFPRAAPPPAGAGRAGWGGMPPRQPLYSGNSALLTQLAQPSYPPPPPQVNQAQRLPSMVGAGQPPVGGAAPPQRQYIWSGVLEWIEKGKGPGDQQKVTKMLPCQVSANSKDIEPELKVDTWPSTLLMQLMPKQLISNIGGQYLKDSKSVLFHLQPNEALDALTKVMVNGFAGCVHFSSPSQCDIKVLILLYTPDKKAYLGFIPNNQVTFVDRLRKVIQQQKITQIINKQMPTAGPSGAMPAQNMPGGSGTMPGLGMTVGGAGGMGGLPAPAQQIQPPAQHQHQQNMMMSAGPGVGGVGGVPGGPGSVGGVANVGGGKAARPSQLDGLEAARQQNLEKIQHLQQTLEAAHQQELQFKSQMDIMSHLQAAQQQELSYKQLEEQQRKQQQQQFQQQQLRGAAGAGGVGGVLPHAAHAAHATHAAHAAHAAHQPRIMRPMMPSNPGLRHLLQQQPYRPGSAAPRPASQQQQFEDVNNYDFL